MFAKSYVRSLALATAMTVGVGLTLSVHAQTGVQAAVDAAFAKYRNLKEGKNTVLVKICQSPAPNPEPNWEFFLRVVDATGKGIAIKNGTK